MTEEKPNKIGRIAVIEHQNKLYVANVLDLVAGTDRIKRVRIQRDLYLQGKVLMPGQYEFVEWGDDD
jgi:hypothetical protein